MRKIGLMGIILSSVFLMAGNASAETVTSPEMSVCSYDKQSNCMVTDYSTVNAPVAGSYSITARIGRGTHSYDTCQAHEDFTIYINGRIQKTSRDSNPCEPGNHNIYTNEDFGKVYLKAGNNTIKMQHAYPVSQYGKTGEAESVSVVLTFSKPNTSNGQCGSSNGKLFNQKPIGGLCSAGKPSVVTGSGPWTWMCFGMNGGQNATCRAYKPICGNGKMELQEECDDGNLRNGDGCSSVCKIEPPIDPVCGDGNLDPNEQCDDGNNINGDGCSATCTIETPEDPYCGDGNVDPNEQCDDGNNIDGDGCSSVCVIEQEEEEDDDDDEPKGKCKGSIGNYIWNDVDMDGVQDSNEKGIENIRIKAVWDGGDGKFGNSNDETFRTDTNHNGHYEFKGLCEGEYKIKVKEEDLNGLEQTYDPDGDRDNKTKVELKGNKDKTTKIDFGYAGKNIPVTGPGKIALLLALAVALATMIFLKRNKKIEDAA